MGPDYEKLEEICSIYEKANYEKGERIKELEEENQKLKEKLSEITMTADDEKQSIEHILELEKENKKLENKIHKLGIRIYQNLDGEKRKEFQEYCKKHRL